MASKDLTSDWAPVHGSGAAGTAGAAAAAGEAEGEALGRGLVWAARSAGDALVDVWLSVTVVTTSSLRRAGELVPVEGSRPTKKPFGPPAGLKGARVTAGASHAPGEYEDLSHMLTVLGRGMPCQPRARRVSPSGR